MQPILLKEFYMDGKPVTVQYNEWVATHEHIEVLEVEKMQDRDGDLMLLVHYFDHTPKAVEVEPIEEEVEQPKCEFNVGDRIIITDSRTMRSDYKIGDKGVITDIADHPRDDTGVYSIVVKMYDGDTQYIHTGRIKLDINEPIEVGDIVVVVDRSVLASKFKNGDLAKIRKISGGLIEIEMYCGATQDTYLDRVRKATPEEIEGSVFDTTLRVGDVVKLVDTEMVDESRYGEGDIGVITSTGLFVDVKFPLVGGSQTVMYDDIKKLNHKKVPKTLTFEECVKITQVRLEVMEGAK